MGRLEKLIKNSDLDAEYDAIMSFYERYEDDIENAPDGSLLYAFNELGIMEIGSLEWQSIKHLITAMYIIANIYNNQRAKEENEDD